MKHLFIAFILLLVAKSATSGNHADLCYDKIEISIVDAPLYSGTFKVIVTSQSTVFKFYYLTRKKKTGKTVSVATGIHDIDDSIKTYLRNAVIHYFVKEDKDKYDYYDEVRGLMFTDPEPAWISIRYIKGKRVKHRIFMHVTSDVMSKEPLCNDQAYIIYADGYAKFLKTMLELVHRYSNVYMKRKERFPGVCGWCW